MELKDLENLELTPSVRLFLEEALTNPKNFEMYADWKADEGVKVFCESNRPKIGISSAGSSKYRYQFYHPSRMEIFDFKDNYKALDQFFGTYLEQYRAAFEETFRSTVTGLDKPVKVDNRTELEQTLSFSTQDTAAIRPRAQTRNVPMPAPNMWEEIPVVNPAQAMRIPTGNSDATSWPPMPQPQNITPQEFTAMMRNAVPARPRGR